MLSPLFSIVGVIAFILISTLFIYKQSKEHAIRFFLGTSLICSLILIPIYLLVFFQGSADSAEALRAWVTLVTTAILLIATCYFSYKYYYIKSNQNLG